MKTASALDAPHEIPCIRSCARKTERMVAERPRERKRASLEARSKIWARVALRCSISPNCAFHILPLLCLYNRATVIYSGSWRHFVTQNETFGRNSEVARTCLAPESSGTQRIRPTLREFVTRSFAGVIPIRDRREARGGGAWCLKQH